MAINPQDPVLAKRRYFNSVAGSDASASILSKALWSWLMQQGGKPNLQVVEFDHLTADAVIANAACTLYAILLKKTTTTAATFKGSDHASVQAASTQIIAVTQTAVKVDDVFYPKGQACALGFTVSSDTTPDGTTDSSGSDGAAGVVLLGA
jgi:hypothetical protein